MSLVKELFIHLLLANAILLSNKKCIHLEYYNQQEVKFTKKDYYNIGSILIWLRILEYLTYIY